MQDLIKSETKTLPSGIEVTKNTYSVYRWRGHIQQIGWVANHEGFHGWGHTRKEAIRKLERSKHYANFWSKKIQK